MTREEAIIQLRLGPGINEDVSEKYNDAVDIAIEALERGLSEDSISRQGAIEAVRLESAKHLLLGRGDVLDILYSLPSADRPRGRWHYSDGKPATIGQSFGVICDQCGTESEYCTNFCGECGADMRGEDE